MAFVDTHVHLHFPEFRSEIEQVVQRARDAGVRCLINVGTDLESSRRAVEVAEQYDFVFATVGIHPHDAKEATSRTWNEIAKLAQHDKVVAIGEVGLDFYRNLSPKEVQRKVFIRFMELATRTDLPLVLHLRDSYEEAVELLEAHMKPPIRAVSHCFSATMEIMQKLVRLGLYISFAGPVSYPRNEELREALAACPEDRLLLETDAPYLAPQAFRGKRNEPAYLVETARRIADVRGISLDELAERTSQNAGALFGR